MSPVHHGTVGNIQGRFGETIEVGVENNTPNEGIANGLNESAKGKLQWVRISSENRGKTRAKRDIEDVNMGGEIVVLASNVIVSRKCITPDCHWWIKMRYNAISGRHCQVKSV